MCVSLYQVRWPHQVQVNLFPHYLEKNKDEAAQDPNKLWSAPNRVHASGRKPAKEYPSTSILGKIYDLVKKEDLNKPIEGMNLVLVAWYMTSQP